MAQRAFFIFPLTGWAEQSEAKSVRFHWHKRYPWCKMRTLKLAKASVAGVRKKKIGVFSTGILIALLIGAAAVWLWWDSALQPYGDASTAEVQIFTVSPGMTAAEVAIELENRELIRSAEAFQYLARWRQVDAKLMAGEYSLSAAMSAEEIVAKLLQGPDPNIVRVTIPEGYNTKQIIDTLVSEGLGTEEEFRQVIETDGFEYSFLADVPAGEHRLEGFLFPDTYFFDENSTPHSVVDTMLQRFAQELTPDAEQRLLEKDMSVYDWVTLSSIVEKEALKQEDRPVIAGVFENRLEIGMPLQSCATVQFLFETPKPKLYEKDLQTPSPYNTYLHAGLPPGPIASPGHASLQAVLYPEETDYLYFLAKNDGYHVFAQTYEEHLRNQRKYLE